MSCYQQGACRSGQDLRCDQRHIREKPRCLTAEKSAVLCSDWIPGVTPSHHLVRVPKFHLLKTVLCLMHVLKFFFVFFFGCVFEVREQSLNEVIQVGANTLLLLSLDLEGKEGPYLPVIVCSIKSLLITL